MDMEGARVETEKAHVERDEPAREGPEHGHLEARLRPPRVVSEIDQRAAVVCFVCESKKIECAPMSGEIAADHRNLDRVIGVEPRGHGRPSEPQAKQNRADEGKPDRSSIRQWIRPLATASISASTIMLTSSVKRTDGSQPSSRFALE